MFLPAKEKSPSGAEPRRRGRCEGPDEGLQAVGGLDLHCIPFAGPRVESVIAFRQCSNEHFLAY